MYFIIWETPSEANPAKAERPSVLPIVGANVPPSDRVFVDSDALTCLLMFCFCEWNIDTFIQIVVLFCLLTIFCGACNVNNPYVIKVK